MGMQVLARALKGAALELTPEDQRDAYLADSNEDYGSDVIRVTDVQSIDCWYGFIYTQNRSPYRLKETLCPELTGLEVVWPQPTSDSEYIELDIPAGHDHIIILKRT